MTSGPPVSIALPVRDGADTLAPVVESVLAQSHADLELVISDNASTDGTEEICRHFARLDERVVYRRHPVDVGLLDNFRSAAQVARGRYLRWIGDDDTLGPDYAAQVLRAFAEDGRRVLVTTQIGYVGADGIETPPAEYDATRLSSGDPVERLAELLLLLTSGFELLDPLYGTMRRELALLPRHIMLREDEVFAARLALAGPWGHVPARLARRRRSEEPAGGLARRLGVPRWHRHAMDVLQCRELLDVIARSALDPEQRRRARAEVVRVYLRRKRNLLRRGAARLERAAGAARPRAERPAGDAPC